MFVPSVRSEWLKRRRSLTTLLVLGAASFIPALLLAIRLFRWRDLPAAHQSPLFWERLWAQHLESMAIMIGPLTIMLIVSLVTQIEYRNNAWKQVHASPQPLGTIFFAKLTVILAIVVQMFLLFNVAFYVAAMLPAWLLPSVSAPAASYPLKLFLWRSANYLVDMLPIVAVQFLLALRFRSFVLPLAVGMVLWILSLGFLGWEFNYLLPYGYATIDYSSTVQSRVSQQLPASPRVLASSLFAGFTLVGYAVYVTRKDRG